MFRVALIWTSGAAIGACATARVAWRKAERDVLREVARAKQPHWS